MYLVFAKDLLSNSHPSNGFVGSNIFLSEVCGVAGISVSFCPAGSRDQAQVGSTGSPCLCHCGVLLPFCGDLQLH